MSQLSTSRTQQLDLSRIGYDFLVMGTLMSVHVSVLLYSQTIALSSLCKTLTLLASPFGLKMLLGHIEAGGEEATVKPWFWVLWLLFIPIIGVTIVGLAVSRAVSIPAMSQ